ncbi:amino acid ABC transporter substrate-binding protein [Facklamia sp. DSM 111018]|uniref:Amino acid ABC transporter substrate-binding protein n=1 Tax=Facklamia lactis TaxID=2749967 RepID=A0ABS0LNF3_9LACT|nr:amino acid ABC transporter substrate-binding protein [Facklamia lactis]MBG9979656.1 amino acid ABC transporter substrate-binding protein [Facklamia lactis]MBG9985664.1 amino acid ABC transporter substrate-binding protein [Facklamia lactis]
MKKALTIVLVVVGLSILFGPGLRSNLAAEIQPDEKVIIGFDSTFAPFGFKDEQGNHVGFDLDLAEEILGRMGMEYEFQPIDWTMKETELKSGQIDMIWNGYSVTPERQEVVTFSAPYIQNRQVIMTKRDSNIQSKADLAGKVIATQEQSASYEAVMRESDFAASLDGGEPVTYATFVEVFSELDNGRVEAIVVDELLALYYIEQQGESDQYRTLDDHFGTEDYAVGFRQDDQAFVESFNKVLKEVIDDGTMEAIEAKWFAGIEKPNQAN